MQEGLSCNGKKSYPNVTKAVNGTDDALCPL